MIELRRAKSRISLSPTIWMMSIELARLCGWEPMGTRRIEISEGAEVDALRDIRHLLPWQVEYTSADAQTVIAEDARRLAEAFMRAVAEGDSIVAQWIAGQIEPPALLRTPCTGFVWFGTAHGKDHLQAIADFCRKGEFQIC